MSRSPLCLLTAASCASGGHHYINDCLYVNLIGMSTSEGTVVLDHTFGLAGKRQAPVIGPDFWTTGANTRTAIE